MVVNLTETRKKRLGLETRGLLAVLGLHIGQCLTNAMIHTEQVRRHQGLGGCLPCGGPRIRVVIVNRCQPTNATKTIGCLQ